MASGRARCDITAMLRLLLTVMIALSAGAAVAVADELPMLEKRWHKCVRQAFSGQPVSVPKRAAELAALAECKPAEDAYVAAMLSAQQMQADARRSGGETLGARARAWLAYVLDPLAGWFR